MVESREYHVALSFAGEDRAYVEQVASLLKGRGLNVFYDSFDEAVLWGKDLYVHLSDVYRRRAHFAVIFISKHYARKAWPNLERQAAQARAFEEAKEYILPARFDDTDIPGILSTQGFISLSGRSPDDLVALIVRKLEEFNLIQGPKEALSVVSEGKREGMSQPSSRFTKMPSVNDAAFFDERFAASFPGVRGMAWFDGEQEVAYRLASFFNDPIRFSNGNLAWWFRGGACLQVDVFKRISDRRYLMNHDEIVIRRICAVHQGSYFRRWIYVETEPDAPTGLYGQLDSSRQQAALEFHGYVAEEYGLVDDGTLVTWAEYDDGATVRSGRPTDLRGRLKLRVRYLTPYNFILAPNSSPINCGEAEHVLEKSLNELVRGNCVFDDMAQFIRHLPRRTG